MQGSHISILQKHSKLFRRLNMMKLLLYNNYNAPDGNYVRLGREYFYSDDRCV